MEVELLRKVVEVESDDLGIAEKEIGARATDQAHSLAIV